MLRHTPVKKHMSLRDVLFVIVVCAAICAPGATYIATHKFSLEVPDWFTMKEAQYLQGDKGNINVKQQLSIDGFISKDFQSTFEEFLSVNIPAKGTALLTNAAMQRMCIVTSNVLFQWPYYYARYQTKIGIDPKEGRYFEAPIADTESSRRSIEHTSQVMSSFAERHSGIKCFVYLVPESANIAEAPSMTLVSNPLTYPKICDIFLDNKGETLGWIDGTGSYVGFLEGWYKTDHHWNTIGAYDAYERVAKTLGFGDELIVPTDTIVLEEPKYYALLARMALDGEYYDNLIDLAFDTYPEYAIAINGEEVAESALFKRDLTTIQWDPNRFADRYAELFHKNYAEIEITNPNSQSPENLLIVGDSYTNCMERFLAAHFATTYVVDPRYMSATLDEYLAEHEGITDIVFLMRRDNMFGNNTDNVLRVSYS